jgi:hypothetical protein
MKNGVILILTLITCFSSKAQFNKYIVKFKNKGSNNYSINNPGQFLTQRAIDRRIRYNITLDSTDLPVSSSYIDSVRLSGNVTILNKSKWLNQISIRTTDQNALRRINNFSFVESASPIASKNKTNSNNKFSNEESTTNNTQITLNTRRLTSINVYNYGRSDWQVKMVQGDFLHDHGFRGNGMQMAILDAGFFRYNTLATFDSIRLNNQILGTWDFVNNEVNVANDDNHGMKCLSVIGANLPGVFVGSAPKTSFYLYRTEDANSEYPIEEHNLAAGAERADSLGVDICSISLGYNTFDSSLFDYTYSNMTGNYTMSARAVNLATKKGLLMVVSAGNEGNNSWQYVTTPGDADSAFTIGSVDSLLNPSNFSSYGPNYNQVIKPNVAALGSSAIVASSQTGLPVTSSGTSFSCPNIAGITSCLWQAFPEAKNRDIMNALQESASSFSNPNNRIGYGIPNSKKAFVILQKKYFTKQISLNQCIAIIDLFIKTDSSMNIEIERKLSNEINYSLIALLDSNQNYGLHHFNFSDDMAGLNITYASYRFKVIIGTDTTYYIDSSTINYNPVCASASCNFTYSNWSNCTNGFQIRTYTASPSGCIGVPPADSLQRTCTNPVNCNFTYSNWSNCENGIQVRTYSADPSGCIGVPPADSLQRTRTNPVNCNFTYSNWSNCENGIQVRTYSADPSGCIGVPPADSLQRTCTNPVNCNFTYSNWSNCVNGIQVRTYSADPTDCIGVPPADSLLRNCSIQTNCIFLYSDWTDCNNGIQQRSYTSNPAGCIGIPPTDSLLRVCFDSIMIKPNPVINNITIFITRKKDAILDFVFENSLGQKIKTKTLNHLAGANEYMITLNRFSKGVYFLKIYANKEKIVTRKLIKL